MRALWVDSDGRVVNIIEYADEVPAEDSGYRVVIAEGTESVGDIVVLSKIFAPVSRMQMLIALHRLDMLEGVKTAVANSQDIEVQIAWQEASEFRRDNIMMNNMAQTLGIQDEQIDAVFELASTVQ